MVAVDYGLWHKLNEHGNRNAYRVVFPFVHQVCSAFRHSGHGRPNGSFNSWDKRALQIYLFFPRCKIEKSFPVAVLYNF